MFSPCSFYQVSFVTVAYNLSERRRKYLYVIARQLHVGFRKPSVKRCYWEPSQSCFILCKRNRQRLNDKLGKET